MLDKDDLKKADPKFYSFLVMTKAIDRYCSFFACGGIGTFKRIPKECKIDSAFQWRNSREGFLYWSDLDRRWRSICEMV